MCIRDRGDLVHAGTYMPVPSFWGQEYPGDEKDIGQYVRDREVESVIAACVYIKREVIEKIGPLDEDYFSYFEDTDYCLKARESGYRVFCCGRVTVKPVSYTHLRAHETRHDLVCRLLLEKKKTTTKKQTKNTS